MTCKDCIHYEICEIFSEQYGISKVYPSECGYAKDKSRLVELPCKVGDPVYQVDTAGRIYESKVSELIYACSGFAFDKSAIGKRVFLTYEEAEKASKEREENAEIH